MNARPEWLAEEDAQWGPSYLTLIKSHGYEVVEHEEFGSYQGDEAALLRDGERWGLSIWGYGSCSGCDELQSIMTSVGYFYPDEGDVEDTRDFTELENLRERMKNAIHWADSKEELAKWATEFPEHSWWSYDAEIKGWVNRVLGAEIEIPAEDY